MTRRYGRTQRRRAREAITTLTAEVHSLRTTNRGLILGADAREQELLRVIAAHERNARIMASTLGEHSVFLPTSGHHELVAQPDTPSVAVDTASGGFHLHRLFTAVDTTKSQLAVHMYVRIGDLTGPQEYFISRDALDILPPAQIEEIVANEIAPALSRALARAVKGTDPVNANKC